MDSAIVLMKVGYGIVLEKLNEDESSVKLMFCYLTVIFVHGNIFKWYPNYAFAILYTLNTNYDSSFTFY